MKVVNFGSLNIDYTYRVDHFVQPGETKQSQNLSINCGGKGLNQSIALAQAGIEIYHAGFVGTEGTFLVDKLRSSGVHTDFVQIVKDRSGHAIIQVSDSGQNCILLYQGTNGILTEAYVDEVLSHFTEGDVVVLQNETNMVGTIMEKAKALGLRIAFNAAPMDEKVFQYPLEITDWLFVNETEGGALTGKKEYNEIALALRERYPNTDIVLTLGEDGCIYVGDRRIVTTKACKVKVLDTTAAGDTFTGFFLRTVLDGQPAERALRMATIASALAVMRQGAAESIPTWTEVERSEKELEK